MGEEIFKQGLNLMAFGMGAVFVFLTLLVIATSIMSAIIGKLYPESLPAPKSIKMPSTQVEDQQIVSAIIAAIKLHRSRNKK